MDAFEDIFVDRFESVCVFEFNVFLVCVCENDDSISVVETIADGDGDTIRCSQYRPLDVVGQWQKPVFLLQVPPF